MSNVQIFIFIFSLSGIRTVLIKIKLSISKGYL